MKCESVTIQMTQRLPQEQFKAQVYPILAHVS